MAENITDSEVKKVITADLEKDLVPFYERGMTNYSQSDAKQLIIEAVETTEIPEANIKRWIENYKAKLKRMQEQEQGIQKPKKEKVHVQKLSGMNLFASQYMTANRGTTMGEMQAAWAALKDNERKQYRTEASELPKISLVKLTDEQKRLKKEKLVKKVENIINELHSMGFNDTLFVCLSENDTACRVYGHKGRDWFYDKGDAAMAEYINQCSSAEEPRYNRGDDTKNCREDVQKIFNKAYAPVMGKSTCSYKEFQEGKFQVEGMPDGVPFKTPGSYGLPCLRKIIDAKEHIQCKKVETVTDVTDVSRNVLQQVEVNIMQTEGDDEIVGDLDDISQLSASCGKTEKRRKVTEQETITAEVHGVGEDVIRLLDSVSNNQAIEEQHSGTINIQDPRSTNVSAESEEPSYEVERIIKRRTRKGVVKYLIQWKGYSQQSWEPEDNLCCDAILKEFKKNQK